MIKAILVDDEAHCRLRFERLLEHYAKDTVTLLGSAESVKEAESLLRENPQVVFLDIKLGAVSAFDWLLSLPVVPFDVVFTTAHNQYAVEAFKVSAVDYLLKPIEAEDLLRTLGKLEEKASMELRAAKMDTLLTHLQNRFIGRKRVCLPSNEGLTFIFADEITRLQADVNYSHIFLKNRQKLTVSKTLKEFEEQLKDYGFFRVHNSHLVNLDIVKQYRKGKGGTLVLMDGTEIEVSTRKKENLVRQLKGR
ncbi:LytR/AlgR family response regulator transcription factor [Negadavirga shengliensis]|uniref:LytR/AlgR family response regulator transcription factor n=1 Tax=Negadavirga shengliensis TaxID=1389218 RepID=A0ABV9T3H1_9BACT